MNKLLTFAVACMLLAGSCKKSGSTASEPVPSIYSKIYGATSITNDGTYITIKSNGRPDHKSCYFPTTDTMYQAFTGTTYSGVTFSKNPNTIESQSLTFKIPVNPKMASSHGSTPLGPIGIAVNGVPLFNQYNAQDNPLTVEIAGFDQWWGHPQNSGQYHYHVEPKYLTMVVVSDSGLLGFLLDGFPVYGPVENGATLTDSSLDAYHGHYGAKADYPGGIYHYHFTAEAPYLNGNGFYGTAGSVSQ